MGGGGGSRTVLLSLLTSVVSPRASYKAQYRCESCGGFVLQTNRSGARDTSSPVRTSHTHRVFQHFDGGKYNSNITKYVHVPDNFIYVLIANTISTLIVAITILVSLIALDT